MTAQQTIKVRAGNPDFLDLDWSQSIEAWESPRLLDLPKGISRHTVRFVGYDEGIYAIKELARAAARNEYEMLRALEEDDGPSVRPVGYVIRENVPPDEEWSTAVITRYLDHSFSYRELLSGAGFGGRRNQMLDAFAGLLVELHLLNYFWGDCSLSNVLYRYDAEAIEVTMVDAETAEHQPHGLTDGQRLHDLDIMEMNVAGGMADIAASQGRDLDDADLGLGADIAARYDGLWSEIATWETIGPQERYLITERIGRLNTLGFEVDDMELTKGVDGDRIRFRLFVHGRNYHTNRLRQLTGVEASEHQARQILADLAYYQAVSGSDSATDKAVGAVRWRVDQFEPWMRRLTALEGVGDPVQAYCDILHHRFIMSSAAERDVGTEAAFADWVRHGRPGYPVA